MAAFMPTYAESTVAPAGYGLAIFYELLSLDEALASEQDACQSDREIMGSAFDDYLAGQLRHVRDTYANGLTWGTAFSTRVPDGEWGSTIALAELRTLSTEQFNAARQRGWLATEDD
jgi:hypothetical protein